MFLYSILFSSIIKIQIESDDYGSTDGIYIFNGKLVSFNNYLMTEEQNDLVITRGANNIFSNTDPFTGSNSDNYTISSQALLESGVASVVFDGATYNAPSKDLKGNSRPSPANTNPDIGAFESDVVKTTEIIVKKDGTGDFSTIQAGINAASEGITVRVYPGTYEENLVINNKNIVLIGESKASTIIDGNKEGSVIYVSNVNNIGAYENSHGLEISGFTIQNGIGNINPADPTNPSANRMGGGILTYDASNVALSNLIVENNRADSGGGIMLFGGEDITLNNVVIRHNEQGSTAGSGTAIQIKAGAYVANTLIVENGWSGDSGSGAQAVNIQTDSNVHFESVTIANNNGLAMHTPYHGPKLTMYNSIVDYPSVGGQPPSFSPKWGNSYYGFFASNIKGGISKANNFTNVDENSLTFESEWIIDEPIAFNDSSNGDYSLADWSALIGKGVSQLRSGRQFGQLTTDILGNPRPNPQGSDQDLGAYENSLGQSRRKTIYVVDKNGSGDYSTIQSAIDALSAGDTIRISAGTYLENIDLGSKSFALIGDDKSTTIIDGGRNTSTVKIGEQADKAFRTVIDNITVQNGSFDSGFNNQEPSGGGILNFGNKTLIRNTIVQNNGSSSVGVNGGGIFSENTDTLFIENSIIQHNIGLIRGGGLFMSGGVLHATNTVFYKNQGGFGGAMRHYGNGMVIINCTFLENTDDSNEGGGAISFESGPNNYLIMNSIIWGNKEPQLRFRGNLGSNFYLINSIVEDPSRIDMKGPYYDSSLGVENQLFVYMNGTLHNDNLDMIITANPAFKDPSNGDFSLKDYSGAIGQGLSSNITINDKVFSAPAKDILGNPRPDPAGSNIDIGAYENKYASPIPEATNVYDGLVSDTVEVDFSNSSSTLSAYWSSYDIKSTMTYYYAIGTSGVSNIKDWTSVGSDTSVVVSDLNLISGETYYFSVFGLTEENVSSDTVRSDGVLIDNENPVVSIVTESSGAFQNQSAYMGNDFSSYPTINDVSVSANFSNSSSFDNGMVDEEPKMG